MDGTRSGLAAGRRRVTDTHRVVERILADGPRREECASAGQYECLRRMWAWEQALRHGPKVADAAP